MPFLRILVIHFLFHRVFWTQLLMLVVMALAFTLASAGAPLFAFALFFAFCATVPMLLRGHRLHTTVATIKGDSSVLWGVRGKVGSTVTGILQSVRDQLTGEMVEIPDDVGFTVAVVLFNDKHECEATVLVQTAFPVFARGDVVSIAGNTAVIVTDMEKNWENKGVAKYTIKGTQWSGIPTP